MREKLIIYCCFFFNILSVGYSNESKNANGSIVDKYERHANVPHLILTRDSSSLFIVPSRLSIYLI